MHPHTRSVPAALLFVMLMPSVSSAAQAGPYDRPRPDEAAVARGRSLYAQRCINCHGLDVKGTENGPDLIRSVAVLRDEDGSEIGPAMAAPGNHPSGFAGDELRDLSHFLKEHIEATSRNRNPAMPPDVFTGNADRGRQWFNGDGGCTGCHSIEGDLAGIGDRYTAVNLQQRFLFPRAGQVTPARVTVTFSDADAVSGTVEFVNDFFISLIDDAGVYRSFRRGPGMAVDVDDPYQGHWDLLERITDERIHDVVTYLGTIR